VLGLIRQKFNYVIVDVPMPLRPELHQVLTLARHVVVVMEPNVASVRNARVIRQFAMTMAGSDRVVTLLNRADMPGGLPAAMVEKALGTAFQIKVPGLGRRMPQSINLGVPAIRQVPSLRKHLAPLIREIAAVDTGKARSSFVRRFLGR
jgi:pilus assembly protein CpaE